MSTSRVRLFSLLPRPVALILIATFSLLAPSLMAAQTVAAPASEAFGNVVVGTTSPSKTVTYTNHEAGSITISALTPTAGSQYAVVAGSTCSGATVPSGGSCTVALTFSPTALGAAPAATVSIVSNATNSPVTVALSGSGIAPSAASPSTVAFGSVEQNTTSAAKSVTVYNYQASTLTLNSILVPVPYAISTGTNACSTGTPVAAGGSCLVYLTFHPTSLGAAPASTVTIDTTATNSPLTVSLTGSGVAPSAVSATALAFANTGVGTTSSARSVVLTNYQTTAMSVATSITGPFASTTGTNACTTSLAASSSCTVYVTFSPTATGAAAGSLSITTNAPNSPLSVALSGTGEAASSVSASSIAFGSVVVGQTSATRSVTLTNYQATALSISSISAPAPYTLTTGTNACAVGTPVAATNGTCSIYLTLKPAVVGSVPASSLTIATSAPNTPLIVALTGTGIQPTAASPTALNFGNIVTGQTSLAKSVTVYNYGPAPLAIASIVAPAPYTLLSTGTCKVATPVAALTGSCTVNLTFTPTLLGAAPASTLVITTNTSNSPLDVSLLGSGEAATTLSATAIAFGDVPVNTTSPTRTITLINNQGSPLTLTSAAFGGPFALDTTSVITNECPLAGGTLSGSLAAGASCVIGVTFQPTASGPASGGKITVIDNSPGGPVSATLTGTGVTPAVLSPSAISFGNVVVSTTSAFKTVTLFNYQTTALAISSITAPAPYTVLSTGTCKVGTPVAALTGSCTVNLTFSPATAGAAAAASLTVVTNSTNSPLTATLSGIGTGAVTISSSLNFGSIVLNEKSTKTLTLINNQVTPLTISPITAASFTGGYTLDVAGTTCPFAPATLPAAGAGSTCIISIDLTPSTVGVQPGTLTVTDNSANSPHVITLTATTIPPVKLSPTALSFPAQFQGTTSAPLTVTLTNVQNVPLTITGATITGTNAGDFGVTTSCPTTPNTLPATTGCPIYVTFTPTASGVRSAILNVADNAGSPLTLALTGDGNAPVLVSPQLLTTYTAAVGTTSAFKTITITNKQSSPATLLHFSSLAFSGDFIQSATTCPLTAGSSLAVGASCTVSVEFDPTIAGTRNGQLQINDDAITSPQVVNFSGIGTSPLTITPSILSFSAQLVNTVSAAKSIVLTNHESKSETFTLTPAGDFSASSNCTSGVIAANSSCTIYVLFTPSSVTPTTRTGSLTITHSAANGSPIVATLSGSATATPPAAAVAVVSPGAGSAGTLVNVVITGNTWTHFSAASVLSFVDTNNSTYANDITVTSQTFVSANQINATLQLASPATAIYGARNITVTTPLLPSGTEKATLLSAFIIANPTNAHSITGVTPAFGIQGQTLTVALKGSGTNWLQGTTYANFGDGIAINSLSIADPTDATANITISNTTPVGYRTITLVTGGEFDTSVLSPQNNPIFQIGANNATLVAIAPTSEPQGWSGQVTLSATGTHFLQNATQVTIAGAIVGDVNVTSPTLAVAEVAVPAGAPLGPQNVTVSTGGEIASLPNAFTITGATPALLSVAPSSGVQGQSYNVVITGNAYTNFVAGQISATFSGNISTGTIVINSNHKVTIPITIAYNANVGSITANLLSGPAGSVTIFPFTFTVTPSSASILSVTPNSLPQGGQQTVTIVGQNTNWSQSNTVAAFYPTPIATPSAPLLTIIDATHATMNVSVPTNTPVGSYGFYLSTGGQIVSSSIGVYANSPTLTMSPGNGLVPSGSTPNSFSVSFTGNFTHFSQAGTLPVIAGEGVTLTNFTVNSLLSATATINIAPGSATGPRLVTFTTGGEIVTTYFNVTITPVGIISISPYHAPQSNTLNVTIVGLNTHFVAGTTQVQFGPQITVNSVTVNSATSLVANITTSYLLSSVLTATPPGWQTVYVNTGAEQVLTGFSVDAPASPTILSVVPSSAPQGGSVNVTITGSLTSWNSSTEAILGAGVTVSNLVIQSATHATATISVSPTAPVGGNSVIFITGSELDSGTGFSVTPNAAEIISVEPNFTCPQQQITVAAFNCTSGSAPTGTPIVAQLQTLKLNVVGQGTHWLQGETTFSFGSGVNVDQLTINSPTTAIAQITVLSSAPVGYASLTSYTDGETVTLKQAIDIEEGSPTLLAISPGSAQQDGSLTLQILGRFTHFSSATNVAFNQDIKVNSFTVIDSENMTANITVSPLAYVDFATPCGHVLTVTTGNEQVSTSPILDNFCVNQGAEEITSVAPLQGQQGSTLAVTITGSATNFVAGETTVSFGDPNFQVGQITVLSPTMLTVPVAISTAATTGFKTITVSTLGQVATQQYSFSVGAGVATLNEAIPNQAEQGAPLSTQPPLVIRLLGQYSHFSASSTATFGAGIAVQSLSYVSKTEVDATITLDPLSYPGGRIVTVATPNVPCSDQPEVASLNVTYQGCTPGVYTGTGTEIVTANIFTIIPGPAIIASISPATGNEGQEVVATITGSGSHWAQNFTQFYIAGGGSDITVNSVVINSPTSATVDMNISDTANPGARSIYMVTNGESLTDSGAFVVTGGIPVITYVSPNSSLQGTSGVEVTIHGNPYTTWNSSSTVNFGPGFTVASYQVDNASTIEAVLNIDPAAQPGYRTVVVQTGTQALTGNFQVTAPAPPPTPYIWYENPSSAIPGQTLTVTFLGSNTHWDPNPTTGTKLTGLNANITLNSFQVTGPTTALANFTISPTATNSTSDITLTTNTTTPQEVDNAQFSVVVAQPVLSVVDPGSGIQGATNLSVNIIGQFTAFDSTTTFSFGNGITVNGPPVILGPTAATQSISIGIETPTGGYGVTANTPDAAPNAQVVTGAGFYVSPSLALIASISPNTALQGNTITVDVTGTNTHWSGATVFQFGAGIVVTSTHVTSATTATLNLAIPPLASEGPTGASATTGGEIARIGNGFVVQAGTPLLLSSGPGSLPQQSTAVFTILSQATNWTSANPPVVSYGTGVVLANVIVTSPTSLTVDGSIQPTTTTGYRNLTVTTGTQTLGLNNAFYVSPGPAVINKVTANSAGQGATLTVVISGTNTNWQQGVTQLNFPGVLINSLTITAPNSMTANITVSDYASAGQVTLTATTLGEVANGTNVFTITQTQAELLAVVQSSAVQGLTTNVTLTGQYTTFSSSSIPFFGTGITVNSVTANSATSLVVNITVQPTTTTGYRNVTVTTGSQVVSLTNAFDVTTGPAAIASLTPATGAQGGSYTIAIVGSQTHFAQGTTTASFGGGATVTAITITDFLHASVTVQVPTNTSLGQYNVYLNTGGEVAAILPGFTVTGGAASLSAVNPPTGNQGAVNLSVQLTGLHSNFVNGTSTANFGAGITVNSLVVSNSTTATATITISPSAALGSRNVSVTTGSEVASITGGFSVLNGSATILTATPATGVAGGAVNVVITGQFTSFAQGSTSVSFGSGITTNSVTVTSATQLTASISIASNASVGLRDISVTTSGQTQTLSNGFTVTAGTPSITVINPNIGVASQSVTVTINGQYTSWVNGTTKANFGAGISVGGAAAGTAGPVTVTAPGTLTASLVIGAAAATGPRTVLVTTGAESESVASGFTVQPVTVSPPSIISLSPGSDASMPINGNIIAVFSQPMMRSTINTTNVLLYLNSNPNQGNIPVTGTVTLDAAGLVMTFTPSTALAVNSTYLFQIPSGGVQDASGNALPYYATYIYTTFNAQTTTPTVVAKNPVPSSTVVGTNATIQLEFSADMNQSTQTGFTVSVGSTPIAGTITWNSTPGCCNSGNGTIATFTPAAALAANTTYTVAYGSPLTDIAGNALTAGSFTFKTAAGPDTTYNSAYADFNNYQGNMGTNFAPTMFYVKPFNPIDITPSTLYIYNYDSGKYIQGAVTLAANGLSARFTPSIPLLPQTQYAFVQGGGNFDMDGNYMYSATYYFVTGSGTDTVAPSVASISPANTAASVPLNAQIVAHFNSPINPATVTNAMTVTPSGGSAAVGTLTLGSDQVTLTFVPSTTLTPGKTYTVQISGYQDFAGNTGTAFTSTFTTATSVAPLNLSTGFTSGGTLSTVDDTPDANWTVTVGANPAVPAKVVGPGDTGWYSGWQANGPNSSWIALNPESVTGNTFGTYARSFNLTGYSLTNLCFVGEAWVDDNGILLINGNAITGNLENGGTALNIALTSSYLNAGVNTISLQWGSTDNYYEAFRLQGSIQTCGASFTGGLSLVSSTPTASATGVATNSTITMNFNNPLDPASVTDTTLPVMVGWNSNEIIAGSWAVNGTQAVFTPDTPFPNSTTIYVGNCNGPYDTAGDTYSGCYGTQLLQFTTGTTVVAAGPFQVTAFTPAANATNVGLRAPITATFNRSFNPGSINAGGVTPDFALYAGDSLNPDCTSYNRSSDNLTLSFNCYALPASTPMTTLISNSLTDMSANGVANFRSVFTTGAYDNNTHGSIVSTRPSNGAGGLGTNSLLVLFTSLPVTPSTANAGLQVSQNGVALPGTIQVLDGGYTLQFTPTSALLPGALIQWSVTGSLSDSLYNASFNTTSGYFNVAASTSAATPVVTASSPAFYSNPVPPNSIYDLQFNTPLNASTVTSSNIYLYDSHTGLPVPATYSMPQPNEVRIVPTSDVSAGAYMYLYITTGLQSTTSVPAQAVTPYFYAGTTDDTTLPTIVSAVPYNGAGNVGVNVTPGVVLSKAIDPVSLNSTTFQVKNGSTPLAGTYTINNTDTRIAFVPNAPLPASTTLTMVLSGVLDNVGHSIAYTSSFTTATGPDFLSPTVLFTSIPSNGTVPINASLTMQFSESMDITTFNANNIYIYDTVLGTNIAATLTWSANQSIAYLVPSSPLAAGRTYYLRVNSGTDLAGNQLQGDSFTFYAGYTSASSAPTLVAVDPLSASTGLGLNTEIEAQFSGALDPNTLTGVTLKAGSTTVAATVTLGAGNTLVQITPAVPLSAGTTYTMTIAGVKDPAGNTVATVTSSFTTGTTIDLTGPSVTTYSPAYNSTAGTNTHLKMVFNKPLNPITVNNSTFRLFLYQTGQFIPSTVTASANGLQVTIVPQVALLPNTEYYMQACCGFTDMVGNSGNQIDVYFYTGAGADTTAPTVSISPVSGATSIPLNGQVLVTVNKPIDPTSWTQSSIQLLNSSNTAIPGTLAEPTNQTFTFIPSNPLAASSTYTVKVSNFTDAMGNAVAPTSSSFTTSTTSSTPGLTLTSTNIVFGATGVSSTQQIIMTFSQILDPATVNSSTLKVMNGWNSNYPLAGTYAVSGNQVTFTPANPYPEGATIYVGECGGPTDILGEVFQGGNCYGQQLVEFTVTSGSSTDTSALSVLSVSPAAGATNVGINSSVSVTFNKAINPYSITNNGNSILLFSGQDLQTTNSITLSADGRTVTFNSGALNPTAVYTISIPAGIVSDPSGNTLASDYISTFTVAADPATGNGGVQGTSPSNGATGIPASSLLTLYLNRPVNPSTLTGNLLVTVNGSVYAGTLTAAANNYEVQFTPSVAFPTGAVVQWFFNNMLDVYGDPFNADSGTFYTAASTTSSAAPQQIAVSPGQASNTVPSNGEIDIEYSSPINAATLAAGVNVSGGGLAATITLPSPNIIRIVPSAALATSTFYYVCTTSALQGTNGTAVPNTCYSTYFYSTGTADSTTGTVAIGPPNSSVGVGTNAYIRLVFSKPIDMTSINATTVQVTKGGVAIPGTFSYVYSSSDVIGANFTPVNPLPPSSVIKVAVSGLLDYTGRSFTANTAQFTTAAMPDYTTPQVTGDFPYNSTGIGTNASFTCRYTEPMDPSSITSSNTYIYDAATNTNVPVGFTFSSDMLSVTMKPTSALTANTQFYYYCNNARDLTGNIQSNGSLGFITGVGTDTSAPTLVQANPPNGMTNVPVNTNNGPWSGTSLGLLFSQPVSQTSLANITLTPNGGSALPINVYQNDGNAEVTVQLYSALAPNTTYTYSIAGVKDYSGNLMSTVTSTFTTGSLFDFTSPNLTSTTPANSATGVAANATLSFTFDSAMNPVLIDSGHLYLRTHNTQTLVPTTFTISADYKTITLTPTTALTGATIYDLVTNSPNWYMTDIAGNPYYPSGVVATFTTQ
jgi:hypothetical protein